jgi:hypothetical protein
LNIHRIARYKINYSQKVKGQTVQLGGMVIAAMISSPFLPNAGPILVKIVYNGQALHYPDFPNKFAVSAVLMKSLSFFDE